MPCRLWYLAIGNLTRPKGRPWAGAETGSQAGRGRFPGRMADLAILLRGDRIPKLRRHMRAVLGQAKGARGAEWG
jgi:hypothetical protein